MFIAFGLGALYYGQSLAIGTPVRMGPGFVPRMLSFILLGLGAMICIVALVTEGEPVEKPHWRPIVMVTLAVVAFGLLFESAGMLPALVVLIFLASWGGQEFKLSEVAANSVVLAALCTLVFKYGLGMNIYIIRGVW